MNAIATEELRKSYGDLTALAGLTLDVPAGELFGLLGPNGAGKSTTIRILTGQLRPDAGTASVLDVDPVDDPVGVRERVGILPEQESPPSFMTPREYFDFVGSVRDLDAETVTDRVETWADRLSYAAKLDTMTTDLSRGQQQKVMITAAFLHDPDLVFIDEPLVNLDPIVQETVKRHLRDYRDAGNTVFLSTHDIDVAAELCDRVGIVREGSLVTTRRPADLGEDRLLDVFLREVGGGDADAGGSGGA
ncbi:ABC transporter, ATP-binding protein [Halarchaeum acidiphilum MH1-52-1]|uniref:ABC transporter, ATP-binding protein n=1 Tax=Halarchaeum acidiphilum MH1-52-1 TaxID=1261545 RepID=U2YUC4_9EURY|nr:ABC transporter ATP-binding protein [Halarchaeum acidiphilum]GAD52322.1 ABC transporter, ATP-binding protein [Halarchaeum acidiphilum MH1-52-1]